MITSTNAPKFTITAEYEGQPMIVASEVLNIMIEQYLPTCLTVQAFLNALNFTFTDETSELSAIDQANLTSWYNEQV